LRTKFISTILAIAVVLAMVMVPAISGVTMAVGNAGEEVMPNVTKVGFSTNFNLEIWARVPVGSTWDTADAHLDFSPTYMTVNSITQGTLPIELGKAFDNVAGTIDYTGGILGGTVSGDKLICTVDCTSGTTSGVSAIDFVQSGSLRVTDVILSGVSILDWSLMVNGTLKVGAPVLTVDVSPAGEGTVKINSTITPSSYPNTTSWTWDQVVKLQAYPVAGWAFDSWTGADSNAVNPSNVTMSVDKSVTANFVELPPVLAVDPLSLDFSARFGDNTDSDTVTISNTGGGTLCWAVGLPPEWTAGDNWTYYDTYSTWLGAPYGNPYYVGVGVNDTPLLLTVTGTSDPDNYADYGIWSPTPERTIEAVPGSFIPAACIDATIVNDKFTLDYVQQTASLVLYMPTPTPVYATVTWDYSGCHGWPYYVGKSWSYVVVQSVSMTPGGTPILPPKVETAYAMVVGIEDVTVPAGTFSCYKTIHFLDPGDIAGTTFTMTWFNDTVKNFVKIWDVGTFAFPPENARVLLSYNVADSPSIPPTWISFDKTHGALGIGGSEVLTVTADTTGLAVGDYSGSFDISAAGSIQVETVDVALEVTPATTIDVIRNLPADALDLDAEYPGDTFDVWVNFTASVDEFNSIGLTDLAPAGWAVQTNTAWCDPVASWTKGEGNKAEYSWAGPYSAGQVFSAMYTVTIPATALNGYNSWPNNDGTKAWAEYWFGAQGPYTSAVIGEYQKIVTVPGKIVGETREVNADLLTTTLVVCSEEPAEALDEPEDSDSSTAPAALYKIDVDDTGQYYLTASKYCWFDLDTSAMPITRNPAYSDFIDFGTTAKLAAGAILDFEGDYGLVPKACTMSYAMRSVNHWLFVPIDGSLVSHPEWQLSSWKAMESVHSWQFPTGCNL